MGYDPLGLEQSAESGGPPQSYDPLGLGPEEKKPSYLGAAKTGFKSGLSSLMKMYEIPSRSLLEKSGLAAPGTFASELLTPSKEEEESLGKLGIPGQIAAGVGSLPPSAVKYGTLGAIPGGPLATAATFAGERAAEDVSSGKKVSPVELGEEAAIGGIFKGIEPLGRAAKAGILAGTFSTQAFGETLAQTGDINAALKAAVAPGVMGAGMGLLGGKGEKKKTDQPNVGPKIPGQPNFEQGPSQAPSDFYSNRPGPEFYNRPFPYEGPYPLSLYKSPQAGLPIDMVLNPKTGKYEPGDYFQASSKYRDFEPLPTGLPPGRSEPPLALPGGPGFTFENTPEPAPSTILKPGAFPKGYEVTFDEQGKPVYPPGRPNLISEAPKTEKTAPATKPLRQEEKATQGAAAPLSDTQMEQVLTQAKKVGGLSLDLVKRWAGVGTKRANAILQTLKDNGEITIGGKGKMAYELAKSPKEIMLGLKGRKKAAESFDPLNWVREKGGINPNDRSADVRSLSQKESGFKGKQAIVREGGRFSDELAQEWNWETGQNLSTDEFSDMLKSLAENKERGVGRGLAPGASNEAIEAYIRKETRASERYDKFTEDPDLLNEDTYQGLTNNLEEEIFSFRKDAERYGISEDDTERTIAAARERVENAAIPPDIEGIRKALSEELTTALKPEEITPPSAISPTRKGETLLPGMKVGLSFPSSKIDSKPTLADSPLMQAAIKAEIDEVQPKLFGKEANEALGNSGGVPPTGQHLELMPEEYPNIDKVAMKQDGKIYTGNVHAEIVVREGLDPERAIPGFTTKDGKFIEQYPKFSVGQKVKSGDFKGVVAEINDDGSLLIGSSDGKMIAATPDKVQADLPGRLPAIMADGELLVGSGSHDSIPAEKYANAKDVKTGWVDKEGNFVESKAGESPEPPPGEETKETPKASMGEAPKEPLSKESVQGFADARLKELNNAPETEVVDTIDDIPDRIKNQLEENMRSGVRGVYDPMSKKIYLVREMLGNEQDVINTVEHEAVGHYATEAYLGTEANSFFNQVYLKYGRKGLQAIADERGYDLSTSEGRINAAKEKIAQLSESGENPGMVKKFFAWMREQLRKIFPNMTLSDNEIKTTIGKARDYLKSDAIKEREQKIDNLRRAVRSVTATEGMFPIQGSTRPAEFSIVGQAKETVRAALEEEIKPRARSFWEGLDWLKKAVLPTMGVDVKDMNTMMKMLGNREMAKSRVEIMTEKGIDRINKMSKAEQVDFIDKVQSGRLSELPADLREIANLHRGIEDSLYDRANQILKGSDTSAQIAYLKYHVRNFWKVVPRGIDEEITKRGFEGLYRRPLEGTRASLHHQFYSLKEGMENGGVPFTTNLLEITRLNHEDTMKLITAHDMWTAIGDIGHRQFVKFGEQIPEGFRPLNDRIANKYFPPKEAGRWVVEDNVGRILENYLSRDLVRENPLLRGFMGLKNITTALELGFSAFHASFITWETIASQIGLGLRKAVNQGKVAEGLKDILEAPLSPYKTFKIGKDVVRMFNNPEEFMASTGGQDFLKMFPEGKEMIGDLFWAGGSVRMNESYRINSINTFRENLNSKNYIGAALRSIPAVSQWMMKPLFESYIPSLKRAVFFKEFANELQARQADLTVGKITRPELARNVWNFVENRFGEMSFDNLWWNRTMKSGLQMGVRSVTWKLGNIRAYGKAAVGQSTELLSALKQGRMPKLTQEMAWVWGLGAVTAAMAGIAQYAFTGKYPEDWKDLVYPQIDKQGGRLSLPTYMRDLFSATHSPVKYATSSMSGMIGRFVDILNNKDFYGVQIHDPSENILFQRVDDLIHLAPMPFSIQSMQRMKQEGESPSRQIAGFLGATKAPYWIERTEAEQKASELKAAHLPIGGRSPADFQRGQLLKNYAKQYQEAMLKGESTDQIVSDLHKDISSGKLRMQDLLRFQQRISKEPLVDAVSHLPFKDVLDVWNVASKDEKKKLLPVLQRKFYGLRSPEDRIQYGQKMRDIVQEFQASG